MTLSECLNAVNNWDTNIVIISCIDRAVRHVVVRHVPVQFLWVVLLIFGFYLAIGPVGHEDANTTASAVWWKLYHAASVGGRYWALCWSMLHELGQSFTNSMLCQWWKLYKIVPMTLNFKKWYKIRLVHQTFRKKIQSLICFSSRPWFCFCLGI